MSEIFVMGRAKEANAGAFSLPAEFNREELAAEWVKKGAEVDAKRGAQPILGTNYGSPGWKPWVFPEGHRLKGKNFETSVKTGTYVLMCRKRAIQDDVNALYGNVSKQHLVRETAGETIAGQAPTDLGMLTDQRIREATGIKEFGGDDPKVEFNQVRVRASQVEEPPAATVET